MAKVYTSLGQVLFVAAFVCVHTLLALLVQGDVMLRALRFMDSMIQRDTMQKAAFLNDLTTFWQQFDDRVLRLKVLYSHLPVTSRRP